MTCAEAVREHVLTLGPVAALVNARVWTWRLPQSPTLPAVLIQQIDDVQQPHLRGTDGLKWARLQIDSVAATIAGARAVDDAIVGTYAEGSPTGPTGIRGAVFTVGSPGVTVRAVQPIGYREGYDADELKQARISRDFKVWYQGAG